MLPCHLGFSPSASERTRHSVGLDLSRLGNKVTFFTRILENKVKGRTEEDLSRDEGRTTLRLQPYL